MKFNQTFIAGTLEEAADHAASRIAQNYTLTQVATAGSCTIEEAQNIYELAFRVITEGSEDLIPENLELPDATDEVDPMAAQDAEVDADVAAANADEDGDFNVEDLEGIILPDSEGNQYVIQGGIIVPYTEEDAGGVMPTGEEDEGEGIPNPELQVEENTNVDASNSEVSGENQIEENTSVEDTNVDSIEENTFPTHSSIIATLLNNSQFK